MQRTKIQLQTITHLAFLNSEVFTFPIKILLSQQGYFVANICFMNIYGAGALKSMQTSQKYFNWFLLLNGLTVDLLISMCVAIHLILMILFGYFLFLCPALIRLMTESKSGRPSWQSVCTFNIENINIIQHSTFFTYPRQ